MTRRLCGENNLEPTSRRLILGQVLRKIGWIIAVGNIIMVFFSANYFLVMAKFPESPMAVF